MTNIDKIIAAHEPDYVRNFSFDAKTDFYSEESVRAMIAEVVAEKDERFFVEHGMWHDRITGQHMYTQDQYDALRRDAFHNGYMDMLRSDLIDAEVIDASVDRMFMTEAILGTIQHERIMAKVEALLEAADRLDSAEFVMSDAANVTYAEATELRRMAAELEAKLSAGKIV